MLGRLSGYFRELALDKAGEEGLAYEKAIEYYFSIRYRNSEYLQRLITFFQAWKKARDNGECPSLKELGGKVGFGPYYAGKLLYHAGLNPFHQQRKRSDNPYSEHRTNI